MKRAAICILALAATAPVLADGPKYKTMDGARWKEWQSIIIEADGYPEEQDDARVVHEVNHSACADWQSERKGRGASIGQ